MSGIDESALDRFAEREIVFDQQHVHVPSLAQQTRRCRDEP
jgi:hypothetical protein